MGMTLSPERRRLLYRATHRGTKEADLIVGGFATDELGALSEEEITEFVTLLEVPDQDLVAWVTGIKPVPEEHDGPVYQRMAAHDVVSKIGRL